jgi:hypothetical protein
MLLRSARSTLGGNPYLFLGRRPFREARLRAYIVREHAAGRPLGEILRDRYVSRCGGAGLCRIVLIDRRTIEALKAHVRDEFDRLHP